jgi:hypothetical protein
VQPQVNRSVAQRQMIHDLLFLCATLRHAAVKTFFLGDTHWQTAIRLQV